MSGFLFACPSCRGPLEEVGPDEQRCPVEGTSYHRIDGIWRFLTPDREGYFRQFMKEYETVRHAEGRGAAQPEYYRALPFQDLSGFHADNWRIRAKSFEALQDRVLQPSEARMSRALKILDLGAGNGWLSYRLALRGHQVAAVDLLTDGQDGLGAHVHYDAAFTPIQGEFHRLPFAGEQMDVVVFNASFHYSTDYVETLAEILRVLRPDGCVVVMDSPVYHRAESGAQMVKEREAQFQRDYGFPSNALPNENYLTYHRLDELASALGIRWQLITPFYGWRWALKPLRARLRGRREPAKFHLIVGRRVDPAVSLSLLPRPPVPSSPRLPVTRLKGIRASLWRWGLRGWVRLVGQRRYDRLVLERVVGKPILVLPQVFNPRLLRTGEFLVRSLSEGLIPRGSAVLDMGTGSGVGAVFAAQWANRVVAVDINPEAVRCARINISLNRLEHRVEVRHGDLFTPVEGELFDVVLFNPPYYRGVPRDDLDRAWRGIDVVERFAEGLPRHLAPDGHALVILSTDGEQEAFLNLFESNGFHIERVAERNLVNEVVTLYRLSIRLD